MQIHLVISCDIVSLCVSFANSSSPTHSHQYIILNLAKIDFHSLKSEFIQTVPVLYKCRYYPFVFCKNTSKKGDVIIDNLSKNVRC